MIPEPHPEGTLRVIGRIRAASNATFLAEFGGETEGDDAVAVVYKPVAGERPLWDFPDGDLAARELAAYLVSEELGWAVVPQTWLGEGPHGPGMLQRWCEPDPEVEAVTIVPEGAVPDGFRWVFDGYDVADRVISLVHEDSPALRRMAVFDAMVNNADRKGGHVLAMADGHRYGCDHGLTFHHEPKLRTVLWGWQDEPLTGVECDGIRRVRAGLDGVLGDALGKLLSVVELAALAGRCDRLLDRGRFPVAADDRHVVPWPPF
ncbi:MAG: SCO1664 family protein [Nocardioides sp.]|uniref:SCO1664 family protein n=1 Tax=Nocardioides sp. TaxID=35761 RepID=UPI0039E4FEE3